VGREALGLIETRGFVAAVEASDAMCKAAHVRLVRYEVTRDALVTIVVRGDVAAVDASVAAGASAATRVGELLARHVIPAPEPQLEHPIGGPRVGSGDRGTP
jgi:ethanolamine utilization protein EutM